MYLSKRKNGIWYVFYLQSSGKKTCIFTKSKLKREAVKFLSSFSETIKERNHSKVIQINLKDFSFQYLKHSETIHRPKTANSIKTIFSSLIEFCGNKNLTSLSIIDLKKFLEYKYSVSSYSAEKIFGLSKKSIQ